MFELVVFLSSLRAQRSHAGLASAGRCVCALVEECWCVTVYAMDTWPGPDRVIRVTIVASSVNNAPPTPVAKRMKATKFMQNTIKANKG